MKKTKIVTELELICDKSFLKGLMQSTNLIGGLFSLSGGFLSDKFGRKKNILVLFLLFLLFFYFIFIRKEDSICHNTFNLFSLFF